MIIVRLTFFVLIGSLRRYEKFPRDVLVTGAAGYIGSIVVPELLKQGHHVIAVDNFMYGQSSLLDVCRNRNLEIVRGDVRNEG